MTNNNESSLLKELEEFEGLSQLVSRFSEAMRARLWEKMAEGFKGWNDDSRSQELITDLKRRLSVAVTTYLATGEYRHLVDVANLAAILWLHELDTVARKGK